MLANLAVAVVRYERVKTTEAKAKEVRGVVDRMITIAKRGDLAARRSLVAEMPHEPLIIDKLMGELATKYAERSSGFTRIVKIGERLGDAAPIVQIELV
jgi:large subunit ribosomal protein L17